MAIVVAVIGKKKSGKTTAAEFLTSGLVKLGFRVGCLKHVHHPNFTFDTKGKDTWRYAQAGAEIVIGAATDEVVVIIKTKTLQQDLSQLLNLFKNKDLDYIILEGFHTLISNRKDVYKIIAAQDEEGLKKALPGTSPPILAISGPNDLKVIYPKYHRIPIFDIRTNGDQLVKIVGQLASKRQSR